MKKSQSIRVDQIITILDELISLPPSRRVIELPKLVKKYARSSADTISKSELLAVYRHKYDQTDNAILKLLTKKPIRTLSGVTPLTVLTKPYPCPGQCIFCPVDVRMPKSYIASEPGAQRAGQYGFDPYLQVTGRLQAYRETGHPISKVELIVLGGTWSTYPKSYQLWYITRLFTALNDFGNQLNQPAITNPIDSQEKLPAGTTYNQYISQKINSSPQPKQTATWSELYQAQKNNEQSQCRCAGLVLETRPDCLTLNETIRLRRLGATKIQIGIQSLSNQVLKKNKRGHTVGQTKKSIRLLRQAGFKIHADWMPNLYGSNPDLDKLDYLKLFSDPNICPDELKIYPCSLVPNTELVDIFNRGEWTPYTLAELTNVLTFVKNTPEYCRLTRVIRDIPSNEILNGNKSSNLRQLVESQIKPEKLHDIRSREIKGIKLNPQTLTLDDLQYQTSVSTEHFLQFITPQRQIAAFLRLSIPSCTNPIAELNQQAIIREVHVYGQSVSVGINNLNGSQHQGLGKLLIASAKIITQDAGLERLAVISAVGTREYYRKLGFLDGNLYQSLKCSP